MGVGILTLYDQGAWIAVRLMGLCQAFIGELILTIYHPNPCRPKEYKSFEMLYGMMFGGWMLFYSSKAEDLPSAIREKALNIGRFILGLFAILTITNVAESII